MYLISPLWIKAGTQQQKQQNAYKFIKTKQLSTECRLGQERNKQIICFLEFNENVGTTYPKLWDTMKAMLRENFIALSVFINK